MSGKGTRTLSSGRVRYIFGPAHAFELCAQALGRLPNLRRSEHRREPVCSGRLSIGGKTVSMIVRLFSYEGDVLFQRDREDNSIQNGRLTLMASCLPPFHNGRREEFSWVAGR